MGPSNVLAEVPRTQFPILLASLAPEPTSPTGPSEYLAEQLFRHRCCFCEKIFTKNYNSRRYEITASTKSHFRAMKYCDNEHIAHGINIPHNNRIFQHNTASFHPASEILKLFEEQATSRTAVGWCVVDLGCGSSVKVHVHGQLFLANKLSKDFLRYVNVDRLVAQVVMLGSDGKNLPRARSCPGMSSGAGLINIVVLKLTHFDVSEEEEKRKQRTCWVTEWINRYRTLGTFTNNIKEKQIEEAQPYRNFTMMSAVQVLFLFVRIGPNIATRDVSKRKVIYVHERGLVPQRFFSNMCMDTKTTTVVDAEYRFTYVDVGCNERISESGVFAKWSLHNALESRSVQLPPPIPLTGRRCPVPLYFIADYAFAMRLVLQKPINISLCTTDYVGLSICVLYNFLLSNDSCSKYICNVPVDTGNADGSGPHPPLDRACCSVLEPQTPPLPTPPNNCTFQHGAYTSPSQDQKAFFSVDYPYLQRALSFKATHYPLPIRYPSDTFFGYLGNWPIPKGPALRPQSAASAMNRSLLQG
ncbi:hypothetical protein PR048_000470 [Dryococelus australis]|uniref:Uncharacterized protein n=1 Tax=Dryococelus australis TaxID=614101 RepID=A0ABQ9IEP6_9NEOP|nr:hypothetical protein PR048_000470 [Dryococelus australis]